MKRIYCFFAIFTLIIFISGATYADTHYTIKKGDNPSKIAKRFNVSPQEIIRINNLRPDNLKPGKKIVIPTLNKKQETKTAKKHSKSLTTDATSIKTTDITDKSIYHKVKKGDTLSSISKKYSIPVNELKEINNLGSTKLRLGQQLIVKQIGPKTYTVRKGDTIYKIARKFNIDAEELKDINGLETDSLKPGEKIHLEPEGELDELNVPFSNARIDEEIEKITESKELSEMGLKDRVILFAKKLLNIPYRFGGSSLMGIDCSAYVQKVYGFLGIDLPRSAREQFHVGEAIDKNDLSIGDLVFFRTYASFPSHVGIYLGNDLFIHASSKSRRVTIDSLSSPYYLKRFIGAKRLIAEETKDIVLD
ncbi:MAG: LysM peptidoglycan-binding domain-containing protein [Nitrospirota bacterium]|nr:LysM peptidoglycan-binding domain-containing protein [Nitrospirota bacterium]